jgi:type I restriction enzyme, S subunit
VRVNVSRVGDLLELRRDHVAVDEAKSYRQIGIYSWGKGIIRRDPVPGSELSKLRYFSFPAHALLLSNIQAWEGAVAVTSPDEAGFVASNRFLPYLPIDKNSVHVGYLRHYFLSEPGLTQIRRASPGTQVRNRTLGIKLFEDLQIPIPPYDKQSQIAAHLDAVTTSRASVVAASSAIDVRAYLAALPSLSARLFSAADLPTTSVDQLCSSVNDTVHPGDDRGLADVFIGLEYVESHTGRRLGSRPVGDEKGRKFRFQPGDVLFGYLRPYLNKVWVSDRHGLCSVEQFVLRPAPGVASKDLAFVLRSAIVLDQAVGLTHSLQLPRLRLPLLMGIRVPDIRLAPPDLVDALDSLSLQVVRIADLRQKQSAVVANLLPAARNEIFSAMV